MRQLNRASRAHMRHASHACASHVMQAVRLRGVWGCACSGDRWEASGQGGRVLFQRGFDSVLIWFCFDLISFLQLLPEADGTAARPSVSPKPALCFFRLQRSSAHSTLHPLHQLASVPSVTLVNSVSDVIQKRHTIFFFVFFLLSFTRSISITFTTTASLQGRPEQCTCSERAAAYKSFFCFF